MALFPPAEGTNQKLSCCRMLRAGGVVETNDEPEPERPLGTKLQGTEQPRNRGFLKSSSAFGIRKFGIVRRPFREGFPPKPVCCKARPSRPSRPSRRQGSLERRIRLRVVSSAAYVKGCACIIKRRVRRGMRKSGVKLRGHKYSPLVQVHGHLAPESFLTILRHEPVKLNTRIPR